MFWGILYLPYCTIIPIYFELLIISKQLWRSPFVKGRMCFSSFMIEAHLTAGLVPRLGARVRRAVTGSVWSFGQSFWLGHEAIQWRHQDLLSSASCPEAWTMWLVCDNVTLPRSGQEPPHWCYKSGLWLPRGQVSDWEGLATVKILLAVYLWTNHSGPWSPYL